jgi:hypothetical protein
MIARTWVSAMWASWTEMEGAVRGRAAAVAAPRSKKAETRFIIKGRECDWDL